MGGGGGPVGGAYECRAAAAAAAAAAMAPGLYCQLALPDGTPHTITPSLVSGPSEKLL